MVSVTRRWECLPFLRAQRHGREPVRGGRPVLACARPAQVNSSPVKCGPEEAGKGGWGRGVSAPGTTPPRLSRRAANAIRAICSLAGVLSFFGRVWGAEGGVARCSPPPGGLCLCLTHRHPSIHRGLRSNATKIAFTVFFIAALFGRLKRPTNSGSELTR